MKIESSFRLPDAAQDPGTYNLGSGLGYCINQARGIVEAVCGMELDNSRLNMRLGWQPGVGQAHGLERTWEWLQQA